MMAGDAIVRGYRFQDKGRVTSRREQLRTAENYFSQIKQKRTRFRTPPLQLRFRETFILSPSRAVTFLHSLDPTATSAANFAVTHNAASRRRPITRPNM